MMSLGTTVSMREVAAQKARRNHTRPVYKVLAPIRTVPYLEMDISGWGHPVEPVLTRYEFLALTEANPDIGWPLVEVGRFQGVVGAFRMAGTARRQ